MTEWRSTIHAIILQAAAPRVLMLEGVEGWCLPVARPAGEVASGPYGVPDDQLIRIRQALRETLAIDTVMLRCVRMLFDHQAKGSEIIYVFEQRGASVAAVGRWVDATEVSELKLAIADHQPIIETC